MNIGEAFQVAGNQTNNIVNGHTLQLLKTGDVFTVLIQAIPVIDPDMPLGSDGREATMLEAARSSVPAWVLARDCPSQLAAKMDGVAITVTKREDNIGSPFVRFEVVKV